MLYPDLYALLHSDPGAWRRFEALRNREQNSGRDPGVNPAGLRKDPESAPRADA